MKNRKLKHISYNRLLFILLYFLHDLYDFLFLCCSPRTFVVNSQEHMRSAWWNCWELFTEGSAGKTIAESCLITSEENWDSKINTVPFAHGILADLMQLKHVNLFDESAKKTQRFSLSLITCFQSFFTKRAVPWGLLFNQGSPLASSKSTLLKALKMFNDLKHTILLSSIVGFTNYHVYLQHVFSLKPLESSFFRSLSFDKTTGCDFHLVKIFN